MPRIQKAATVNAPAGRVFQAIDDLEMMPRYVPNVTKVSDVQRTDARLGDTFRLTYEMPGIHFDQLSPTANTTGRGESRRGLRVQ